jgi:cell wall-associated NlpC family hydrolase
MPIKRLTVFSVLAAAMLVIAPLQATTSKTHGKSVPATHAQHHKQTHAKTTHHASTHARRGKLVAAKHKSIAHSRQAAGAANTSATANGVATVELTSGLPGFDLLQASPVAVTGSQALSSLTPQLLHQLPIFNPAPMLAQSVVPRDAQSLLVGNEVAANSVVADSVAADQAEGDELSPAVDGAQSVTDLRKSLIAMAMKLRDIRYVRGGRDPATGFDCSGFVRYVFAHAVGMQLPNNSASQFLAGLKVKRGDMKPGDLVFFHTHGKRRISHVGIYISNGRFIHSPNTGKSVEISSLDSGYWAKRFAGAKRPEAMAQVADKG